MILSGIPRTGPKRRASQGWRSHREAARMRPLLAREHRAAGMVMEGTALEFLPWEAKGFDGPELPDMESHLLSTA